MTSTTLQQRIRWLAGLAASSVLVYMSYLSLQEDFSLSMPVIGGMLAVIILLMYGSEELTAVVEAYRNE